VNSDRPGRLTVPGAREWISALVAALLLLPVAYAARADQGAESLDDLATMFDVADQPADFVAVIDVSGSMVAGKVGFRPWDSTVEAYESLVNAMRPQDHLSTIIFGTDATLIFTGTLSDSDARDQAVHQLKDFEPEPGSKRASGTDIGEGLELGVRELERVGAAEVQSVALLTDGKFDSPGSPYAIAGSQAWRELRARAQDLDEQGHSVSAYGFAVTQDTATDAGMIKRVFPKAAILAPPPEQLPEFFENLVLDARRDQVAVKAKADLDRPVAAELRIDGDVSDRTDATLVLHSERETLDSNVTIASVEVSQADGHDVEIVDLELPVKLEAKAGEQAEVPLLLDIPDADRGLSLGSNSADYEFQVDVDATVVPVDMAALDSADVLTEQQATTTVATESATSATQNWGVPWRTIIILLVLIAATALLSRWAYVKFWKLPRLLGYLEQPNGESVTLSGTHMRLPSAKHPLGNVQEDEVLLNTRRRRRGQVWVSVGQGDPKVDRGADYEPLPRTTPLRLGSGDRLRLGSVVVEFHSASSKQQKR
jgi:Mg-chelatase subunit ChlD